LTVGKSSMMSDVWSFGVFIWELYTLAKIPYNELEGGRDIVEYLDANKRLAKPDGCPDPLYALMMSCWDGVPRQRPTFQQLKPQLEQMAVLSCLSCFRPMARCVPASHTCMTGGSRFVFGLMCAELLRRLAVGASLDTNVNALAPLEFGLQATKKATPKQADPPNRNWLFADISRTEAETVLQEWGSANGLFLVRESGPIWVMSRIGRSDEDSELIVHRKINLTNGRYSMQSTRTAPKEFETLDELVVYYQQNKFSDGTSLMTQIPKTNGVIQPVRQRFVHFDANAHERVCLFASLHPKILTSLRRM